MSEKTKDRLFLVALVYITLLFLAIMFATLWEMADMSYTCGWAKILYGVFFVTFISGNAMIAKPLRSNTKDVKEEAS